MHNAKTIHSRDKGYSLKCSKPKPLVMSNKGNALISILILALGAVFIWLYDRDTLPRSIVLLCGLAFVVPAVISLISMFISRRSDTTSAGLRFIQLVCGVGGLGLGLSIILLPDIFRPLLIYPFSALMIVGGAFQVFQISHKYRPVDYPAWMYIAPILILVAGVVALCVPSLHAPEYEKWIVLATGIAGVLFGANGLCISVLSHRLPPLREGHIIPPVPSPVATTHSADPGPDAATVTTISGESAGTHNFTYGNAEGQNENPASTTNRLDAEP